MTFSDFAEIPIGYDVLLKHSDNDNVISGLKVDSQLIQIRGIINLVNPKAMFATGWFVAGAKPCASTEEPWGTMALVKVTYPHQHGDRVFRYLGDRQGDRWTWSTRTNSRLHGPWSSFIHGIAQHGGEIVSVHALLESPVATVAEMDTDDLYSLNTEITGLLAERGWTSVDDDTDEALNNLVHEVAEHRTTFLALIDHFIQQNPQE